MIKYKNKMEDYLYNHNYISNNKKADYQQELSIERAECIINKHDNIVKEEKEKVIKFLKDLIEETECAYNYIENDYKNSGKWNLLNEILDFVKGGKE